MMAANDPRRAQRRASVIVAAIIVIGRNGEARSDAVIGISSLSRAIDGAVRVANYSILRARHVGDNHCEGCKGRDNDSAHYRLSVWPPLSYWLLLLLDRKSNLSPLRMIFRQQ
jgi:hypothetical protein